MQFDGRALFEHREWRWLSGVTRPHRAWAVPIGLGIEFGATRGVTIPAIWLLTRDFGRHAMLRCHQ